MGLISVKEFDFAAKTNKAQVEVQEPVKEPESQEDSEEELIDYVLKNKISDFVMDDAEEKYEEVPIDYGAFKPRGRKSNMLHKIKNTYKSKPRLHKYEENLLIKLMKDSLKSGDPEFVDKVNEAGLHAIKNSRTSITHNDRTLKNICRELVVDEFNQKVEPSMLVELSNRLRSNSGSPNDRGALESLYLWDKYNPISDEDKKHIEEYTGPMGLSTSGVKMSEPVDIKDEELKIAVIKNASATDRGEKTEFIDRDPDIVKVMNHLTGRDVPKETGLPPAQIPEIKKPVVNKSTLKDSLSVSEAVDLLNKAKEKEMPEVKIDADTFAMGEWKEDIKEIKDDLKKNIKSQVRSRTWSSDEEWFNSPEAKGQLRAMPSEPPPKPSELVREAVESKKENIMEIQEKNLAEAHAKMLAAQREYAQQKKVLNDLYESFNVPTIEE